VATELVSFLKLKDFRDFVLTPRTFITALVITGFVGEDTSDMRVPQVGQFGRTTTLGALAIIVAIMPLSQRKQTTNMVV
jgi:hypothetical protein